MKKRLAIPFLLMVVLVIGCELPPDAEADIRIVSWAQSWEATYFGLVEVTYEIENTGSVRISGFELRIGVTCTDTSEYGTRLERSTAVKSGDTFQGTVLVDVFGKKATTAVLTYSDYR